MMPLNNATDYSYYAASKGQGGIKNHFRNILCQRNTTLNSSDRRWYPIGYQFSTVKLLDSILLVVVLNKRGCLPHEEPLLSWVSISNKSTINYNSGDMLLFF